MTKRVILLIPFIIGIAFMFIALPLFFAAPGTFNFSITGKTIEPLPPITNCSSNESIVGLWTSIFYEPTFNITIVPQPGHGGGGSGGDSSTICYYFAYKINVTDVYALSGSYTEYKGTYLQNHTNFEVVHFNATPQYINLLNAQIQLGQVEDIEGLVPDEPSSAYLTQRNISNETEANLTYARKFKLVHNETWTNLTSEGLPIFTSVLYKENSTTNSTEELSLFAAVYTNLSIEYLEYDYRISTPYALNCTPNWTQFSYPSCYPNETAEFRYYDKNYCGNDTGKPNSTWGFCDFNGNGFIGNLSTINQFNTNVNIYLDGNPVNFSAEAPSNNPIVEFREGSQPRVSFRYDFYQPLNLINLTLKKQDSSDTKAYFIVNGLEEEKTIWIDKLNISDTRVCVKESFIPDGINISINCNATDETILNCTSNPTGIPSCKNETNSTYKISGLTHSGVQEISYLSPPSPTCNSNWSCFTNWSNCSNNIQSRQCRDLNNCNSSQIYRNETQTCTCVENWNCTAWSPENCTAPATRSKICTDLNNCGTTAYKPLEIETCPSPQTTTNTTTTDPDELSGNSKKSVIILFSIVGGIVLLIIVGIILFLVFHKKPSESSYQAAIQSVTPAVQTQPTQATNQQNQNPVSDKTSTQNSQPGQ